MSELFADDVGDVDERPALGAAGVEVRCSGCGEWILHGETCEDCERERLREPGQWGPAVDRLARQGYSPAIEHFPGRVARRGYRVGLWPTAGHRTSFIEIGYAETFAEAVELLLVWRPA